MKQVTVIIPNYNGAAYLETCLSSLLKNEESLFDILIVDNASTDGSDRVAERFGQAASQIRLLRMQENTGFTGAVNAALAETATPYVLLLNNDTRVESNFVRAMYEAIVQQDRIFSVSARMLSMKDPKRIDDAGDMYCALGWAYSRGRGKSVKRYQRPEKIFAACGGAAIYRRDVLKKLGGFDDNHFAYLEDIDVGYRARIHGYSNRYEPGAVVYHAGSAVSGSRHNPFKIELASRNSIYLIYKNMPLFQILLNLPFLLAGFLIKTLFFTKKGYGRIYIKGLAQGFCLCAQERGKSHKVRFAWSRLLHYCRIQLWLWGGILALLREF